MSYKILIKYVYYYCIFIRIVYQPVCGGPSVSACADLTNQMLSCWVDPACAWKKH